MRVLGIESSCDETGVALYDTRPAAEGGGLLAHALHTQMAMHERYGGVVPELASRDHIRRVIPLAEEVLATAGIARTDIDAVAYTAGPGLAGALLVGACTATALAWALGVPTIGVHHLEGHLLSPLLSKDPPTFPFVALLVSGGHTQLLRVDGIGRYELLGDTLDDAAGEAFDKSAKLLGLGYPGGPALSRLAVGGDADRFRLPRPLLHSGDLDFSFSGLKTAVATAVRKHGLAPSEAPQPGSAPGGTVASGHAATPGHATTPGPVTPPGNALASGVAPASAAPDAAALAQARADLAAGVQAAIVDVLCAKALAALETTGLKTLVVAGGVSANARLREKLARAERRRGLRVHFPEPELCTDNGAMIAFAGAMRLLESGLPDDTARGGAQVAVRPRWPLESLAGA